MLGSVMVVIFLTKNSLYFTEDDCLPKDEEKPPEETGETHDELFDAIASLFPDKGLTGAEVFRR